MHDATTMPKQKETPADAFAVIRRGFAIIGAAATEEDAVREAAAYLAWSEDQVRAILRPPGDALAFGDHYLVPCTMALVRAWNEAGLSTPWHEHDEGKGLFATAVASPP